MIVLEKENRMKLLDGLYNMASQDPKDHGLKLVSSYEQMTGKKASKDEVVELLAKHKVPKEASAFVLEQLGLK